MPPAPRRLDKLREIVPHAERANTAAFLDEVITYIAGLNSRIAELEADAQGNNDAGKDEAAADKPARGAKGKRAAKDSGKSAEGKEESKKRKVPQDSGPSKNNSN